MILVGPAGPEFLGDASAAFGKPCVTETSFIFQDLSPGLVHGLAGILADSRGQTLISLAMVVRTDVEGLVVIGVEPSLNMQDTILQPVFRALYNIAAILSAGNLLHHPGPGNDRMSLEIFQRSGRSHFR